MNLYEAQQLCRRADSLYFNLASELCSLKNETRSFGPPGSPGLPTMASCEKHMRERLTQIQNTRVQIAALLKDQSETLEAVSLQGMAEEFEEIVKQENKCGII